MAAERADREATLFHGPQERLLLRRVAEQHIRIAVRVARVVAGAELDGFDPERRDTVEHLLERQICEQDGKDAELHLREPRPIKAPTGVEPVYTALQAVA